MIFDFTSAASIFVSDSLFWFLTTIFVKRCHGNFIVQVMMVAGLINASDFVSKYFAPRFFNNIVVAFLAAALGAGLAMLYEKNKKMEHSKLIPLSK